MGVLLAAHDNGVYSNENGQYTGQHTLDCDEYNTSNSLSRLCNAELFDKDQNTHNREGSDDLNEDVDNVARSSFVRSVPDQEAEH